MFNGGGAIIAFPCRSPLHLDHPVAEFGTYAQKNPCHKKRHVTVWAPLQVSEHASWSALYYERIIQAALKAAGAPSDLVQVGQAQACFTAFFLTEHWSCLLE